ncbi:MAG: hypothetical protein ACREUU_19065 [Gammaproteobacteria bacterium]
MRHAARWVCILVLVAATGCGGAGAKRKLELLDEALIQYGQALRWGRYDDLQQYHMNRQGERTFIDQAAMQPIRVTGFSVQNKTVNDEVSEAIITGQVSFYHTDYGTLRQIPVNQTWWFEPESKRWLMDGEFPVFK